MSRFDIASLGARTRRARAAARVGAVALFCAFGAPSHAATNSDSDFVRRLIEAGALQTALARIDFAQPPATSVTWADWESLRCEALTRLRRDRDLIERVKGMRAAAATSVLDRCFVDAARAAIATGDTNLAREFAARLLWRRSPSADAVKLMRVEVIESYVSERRSDEAFRSMLRFQQDYRPLDVRTAERFAEALLDLRLDREALNWLGAAGESTPSRLRLRLRAGSSSPDAVIKEARAAIARTHDARYWKAIYEAGERAQNGAVEIEALERMLQVGEEPAPSAAKRLWDAYETVASDTANRERLLTGDDGAWADYAARRTVSDPFVSRSIYAYLARRAQNEAARANAQLQLTYSLSSAELDRTALRLVESAAFQTLDAQTRYLLGSVAAKRGDYATAVKFWKGLATPVGLSATEWQLNLARAALRAGDADSSASFVQQLVIGRDALSPDIVRRMLELAAEMLDARALEPAERVYNLALPYLSDPRAREAWLGLARAQDLKGEASAAATAYLRAALLAPMNDSTALEARLLAGRNLVRAGFRQDARAQFEWLLKNAKDGVIVDAARRALDRLGRQ